MITSRRAALSALALPVLIAVAAAPLHVLMGTAAMSAAALFASLIRAAVLAHVRSVLSGPGTIPARLLLPADLPAPLSSVGLRQAATYWAWRAGMSSEHVVRLSMQGASPSFDGGNKIFIMAMSGTRRGRAFLVRELEDRLTTVGPGSTWFWGWSVPVYGHWPTVMGWIADVDGPGALTPEVRAMLVEHVMSS
jgi:hypothetical protein